MKDEELSIFFEVVICYHPTDFDKVGCDGVYIKEVKKIDAPLKPNENEGTNNL